MTDQERFLAKVHKGADCWLWGGGVSGDGYGATRVDEKNIRAHRLSYRLFNGDIPDGMLIRHTCDTPLCVRPNHLILGTPKDNSLDMVVRGRKRKYTANRRPNGWFNLSNAKDLFLRTVTQSSACWWWTGVRTRRGYGLVSSGNKSRRSAHRTAYELYIGPIPKGMSVRHACDNPSCVRPDHLTLGTHQDNMRDAIERKRHPRGNAHWSKQRPDRIARGERHRSATHPESVPSGEGHWARKDMAKAQANAINMKKHVVRGVEHGGAKLTEALVTEIRQRLANGERPTHIAKDYAISRRAIRDVGIGTRWAHVPGSLRPDQLPKRGLIGFAHPRARFTAEMVREMRQRHGQGQSVRLIAEEMGLCKGTVQDAICGKTYRDVPMVVQ